MSSYTDSKEYKDLLKKLKKTKKESNEWKAVVTICNDTQLLYFLKNYYPDVLQEFYDWRLKGNDTPDTKVSDEELSS